MKKKRDAEGTEKETEAAKECSQALLKAYQEWVQRTRQELASLQRGSKKWWAKTRELLQQRGKSCHVPALRKDKGEWVTTATEKAQLFADIFFAKYALGVEEQNRYSELTCTENWVEDWEVPSLALQRRQH